jgi:hypothetical protein
MKRSDIRYRVRAGALRSSTVARVSARQVSADALLHTYLSRDRPVVLANAVVDEAALGMLRRLAPRLESDAVGNWEAESPVSRSARMQIAEHVRAHWPHGNGRLRWHLQSNTTTGRRLWGCRSDRYSCALGQYQIKNSWERRDEGSGALLDWEELMVEEDARRPPAFSGSFAHTDGQCMPAWSLQLSGVKTWTFLERTPGEQVPFGESFRNASEALVAHLSPGDLLVHLNGWVPHATEASGDDHVLSVHGNVAWPLDEMVPALYVGARAAHRHEQPEAHRPSNRSRAPPRSRLTIIV